jgi:hypothetical protein
MKCIVWEMIERAGDVLASGSEPSRAATLLAAKGAIPLEHRQRPMPAEQQNELWQRISGLVP